MATVNAHKRFQQFLPQVVRYRAKVLVVDAALNRAQVEHGSSNEWITATINLAVDDQVMVEDGQAVRVLPALPYAAVEVV